MPEAENRSTEDGRLCTLCGRSNPANARFCRLCGHLFGEQSPDKAEQPARTLNTRLHPVCPNCGSSWIEGDKYCRYCGAPMDQPDFREVVIGCIYGPKPVTRRHVCSSCQYSWTTDLMIDKERYCPLCGAPSTSAVCPSDVCQQESPEPIRAAKRESLLDKLFGRNRKP